MKKVVQCILIIAFIFGISGCAKDNVSAETNVTNKSQLETTYLPTPVSSRPKSQKEIDNVFIALNLLKQAEYYESESSGEVIAKKSSMKLTTQKVENKRIITPSSAFSQSISISTFVKVAEQLYVKNDAILKREAKKVSSSKVEWGNSVSKLSQKEYDDSYGYSFVDPSKYVINEDSIIGDIEVVNNGLGRKFTYKLNLKPEIAAYYYKTSIKELSGSTVEPTFKYIQMLMTFDYKWRMTKIETVEEYTISLSGLGKVTCVATMTETFKNINKPISISEESFFSKHL